MHGAKIFNNTSTPVKSADTMHGLTRLLDMAYPEMCIVENVDELADQNLHKEALDMFIAGLASRGYDCKVFILNMAEFGIAQVKAHALAGSPATRPHRWPVSAAWP